MSLGGVASHFPTSCLAQRPPLLCFSLCTSIKYHFALVLFRLGFIWVKCSCSWLPFIAISYTAEVYSKPLTTPSLAILTEVSDEPHIQAGQKVSLYEYIIFHLVVCCCPSPTTRTHWLLALTSRGPSGFRGHVRTGLDIIILSHKYSLRWSLGLMLVKQRRGKHCLSYSPNLPITRLSFLVFYTYTVSQ